MYALDDTIVAIASPPGRRAPRGMIRASGPDSFSILAAISNLTPPSKITRAIARIRITISGAHSLPCLAACYRSPHTYTGQQSVELLLPGNRDLLQRITQAFIAAGARQAEPGEFTARAFFNGKLTLTQAEGVAATIAAESDAQLRAAAMLRQGKLGQAADALSNQVADCLALVEAGIDFSDQEDVVAISRHDLHTRITQVYNSVTQLLDRSIPSEKLAATPSVVLAGPPNAGKSTLFNTLLGRRRAVVSHLAGTTRDVLTEILHLDPHNPLSPEIALSDLAGFDSTDPTGLNPAMQQAAHRAVSAADLVIHLQPSDSLAPAIADESLPGPPGLHAQRLLHVYSKADLGADTKEPSRPSPPPALRVSVHDPESLARLRDAIAHRLAGLTTTLSSDVLALHPRHEQTLRAARHVLSSLVEQTTVPGDPEQHSHADDELVAADLRTALDTLGQLNQRISPDDVLGRVFSNFCIGK
ncbi:MAG: hypothetical protein D8M59_02720 [Planctomycetes bacterium]|nr:hypothetical protein [Planctomycetota bacterium]NOG52905.1 hypothetical protein [Planctomycetota bacterium]